MHLEILQLLQPTGQSERDDSEGNNDGVTVKELRDVMRSVEYDQTEAEDRAWERDFKDALKWLYENSLVYFETL